MRRVTRPRGGVAAYIWDFGDEISPSGPLRRAMCRVGVEVPEIPDTASSRLEARRALFQHADLERIETRTVDVYLAYRNFDDIWQAPVMDGRYRGPGSRYRVQPSPPFRVLGVTR